MTKHKIKDKKVYATCEKLLNEVELAERAVENSHRTAPYHDELCAELMRLYTKLRQARGETKKGK